MEQQLAIGHRSVQYTKLCVAVVIQLFPTLCRSPCSLCLSSGLVGVNGFSPVLSSMLVELALPFLRAFWRGSPLRGEWHEESAMCKILCNIFIHPSFSELIMKWGRVIGSGDIAELLTRPN